MDFWETHQGLHAAQQDIATRDPCAAPRHPRRERQKPTRVILVTTLVFVAIFVVAFVGA